MSLDITNREKLRQYIESQDYQNRGWSTLPPDELAEALQDPSITNAPTVVNTDIPKDDLLEAIDENELDQLSSSEVQKLRLIAEMSRETVSVESGTRARKILQQMFPPGSNTRQNIVEAVQSPVSIARDRKIEGTITEYDVRKARLAVERGVDTENITREDVSQDMEAV